MLVIPSTLQLLLAIVLMLLGVCGNLVIPFVSYRTTLSSPYITILAALDFIATLLGPGLMLVTILMGPNWLEHNTTLCQSLSFLSSLVLITSFLVLFFLAVFCQKVRHNIPSDEKHRGKSKQFYCFLALCVLTGLLLGVQILLGWGVFIDFHLVPYCNFLAHAKVVSKHSFFYLACSFMALSFLTIFLAVRAMKQRQVYPVQLFWQRHKYEENLNDPERTTVGSISSSNRTVTSNRSYWSRRSSGRSRRSTVLSAVASPLVSRKNSQQSRLNMQDVLLMDVLRLAQLNVLRLAASANGGNEDVGKEASEIAYPVSQLDKESDKTPSSRTSRSYSSPPREPFVITPHKLPILPFGKNVFQSPYSLPPFRALQQQRSLSRFLLLKSCVTGACWLPLYAAVALLLSSVQYPQELHIFIQWLIFLPSCISPLFPLCHAGYRRVLRRAACSCFKACACGYQTETAKSRDVEFRIEGTQQVRLMAVRPLDQETLQQTFTL